MVTAVVGDASKVLDKTLVKFESTHESVVMRTIVFAEWMVYLHRDALRDSFEK